MRGSVKIFPLPLCLPTPSPLNILKLSSLLNVSPPFPKVAKEISYWAPQSSDLCHLKPTRLFENKLVCAIPTLTTENWWPTLKNCKKKEKNSCACLQQEIENNIQRVRSTTIHLLTILELDTINPVFSSLLTVGYCALPIPDIGRPWPLMAAGADVWRFFGKTGGKCSFRRRSTADTESADHIRVQTPQHKRHCVSLG